FFSRRLPTPGSTLFPYTTLFRSGGACGRKSWGDGGQDSRPLHLACPQRMGDKVHGCLVTMFCLVTFLGEATRTDVTQWLAKSGRSEEHTSELQSQSNLVCRLLLE